MSKKAVILSILILLLAFLGIGILNVAMGRPSLLTSKLESKKNQVSDDQNNISNLDTTTNTATNLNTNLSENKYENITLDSVLKVGMTGDKVKKLQYVLKSKGYYNGSIDGNFSVDLKTSLEKFQMDNNLKPTGEMGPYTAAALSGDTNYQEYFQTAINRVLYPGSTGNDVKKIQFFLKWTGYYKGEITGNFDNTTKEAVINFQNDNNISPTGNVGNITIAKMNEIG